MKAITFAAGCLAASSALAQDAVLTVYAGDYIVSEWGPGPRIEEMFEARCNCDLQFRPGDLLPRLLLEGARTEADVVFGLNTDVTRQARESGLFAPHGVDLAPLTLPIDWQDDTFLPYNFGHTAFVYNSDRLAEPPQSFQALLDAPDDLKIVIQDPRSSPPGLGLLMWVKAAYGERAPDIWEALAPHVLTVTKGWSEAYGMFTEGEADMVLSYTTSPGYHLLVEQDETKSAAAFDEGHYMQVEVAGKFASTDQPELADQFLQFMLTDAFQSVIFETNWMYPAVTPESGLPAGAETLVQPERALLLSADEAEAARDDALDEWLTALSR